MKNLNLKNTISVALVAISAGFFVACGEAKADKKEFFIGNIQNAKEFGDYIIANQNKPVAFSVGYCINPNDILSKVEIVKIADKMTFPGIYRQSTSAPAVSWPEMPNINQGEAKEYALMDFLPIHSRTFPDINTPKKIITGYTIDVNEFYKDKAYEAFFGSAAQDGEYFGISGYLDNNLSEDFKGIHLKAQPKLIAEAPFPNILITPQVLGIWITGDKAKIGFFEQNTMNDFVEKNSELYDKLTKCPDFKPEYGEIIKPMAYLTGYFEVGKKDEENKITLQSLSEEEYKAKLKGQK